LFPFEGVNKMRSRKIGAPLVAILVALLLFAAGPLASAPPGAGAAPHPSVDEADSCEACHAELTPKPFQLWFEGRHGLMGVKCVVCHGSVGSGFTRKPKADRCGGCHGEKAAAMSAPFFKGKGCFSCHHPHSLNPHTAIGGAS
jgi:Cytochrome c554 and c-prime